MHVPGVDQMASRVPARPKFDPAVFPLVLSAPYPTDVGRYFYLTGPIMITLCTYELQDPGGDYGLTGDVGFGRDHRSNLSSSPHCI